MDNSSGNVTKRVPTEFKCPYCFRKIMANGVAFRSMTAYTQQDLESFTGPEAEKKKIYKQIKDELYENFWKQYPGSAPEDDPRHPTYEKHPVLSPFDDRFVTNSKFKDGSQIIFKADASGFINEAIDTEGVSTKVRICPHCHNKLPFEFGKYPVKYISVVGITSSGKTIFLSQLLSRIQEFLLNVNMTVAGLCPEVDKFVSGHTIRRGENLPLGNTTNKLTEPIPINVRNNATGEGTTLVFYDIAGENCVIPEQMQKYGQFICNADGIIMVVDPRQFSDLLTLTEEEAAEMETAYQPDRVVHAMYEAFGSAAYQDGRCTVPLAVTISKSDLLRGCDGIGTRIFENIAYEKYGRRRGFPYSDWRDVDGEVRNIIKRSRKGEILLNSVRSFFTKSSYFAISALNGRPQVLNGEDGRRYQMEMLPRPIKVEEPLYWILYRLDLIKKIEDRREDERGGFWGLFKH